MAAAAAFRLPQFIVVKPLSPDQRNGYYKKNTDKDGGELGLGSDSIFSPLVKIEVERATCNDKYVNLRFCSSNRYWQQDADKDSVIAAVSKEPIEDTTDRACTLFEPFSGNDSNSFYMKHVSSGLFAVSDGISFLLAYSASTWVYMSYLDWDTLVKLPDHVALKGDNGKYLKPYDYEWSTYMVFNGAEYNAQGSVYNVIQMPDGHVQLFTSDDPTNRFALASNDNSSWIILTSNYSVDNEHTLFWPIKIDSGTIVLRNKKTGTFCTRNTDTSAPAELKDALATTGSTMTAATMLQVEEPTLDRKIYYVNYMMEDARKFDEKPYLAGSSVIVNATDFPTSESVTITYQDQKSYSYSRGFSVTAGVKTEIKAKIPFLAEGKIEVSLSITGNFQWDTTTTAVSATGTVDVPARSSVVIEYVGTQGTCNIPYAYTQLDKSATDGKIKRTEMIDGTYTGVSCYDFSFKISAPKDTIA